MFSSFLPIIVCRSVHGASVVAWLIELRGRESKQNGIVIVCRGAKVIGSVFGLPSSSPKVSRNPLQLAEITLLNSLIIYIWILLLAKQAIGVL